MQTSALQQDLIPAPVDVVTSHPPPTSVLAVRVISVSLRVTFPIHSTMGDGYGVEFAKKLGKF